jgi:hypothetical protein
MFEDQWKNWIKSILDLNPQTKLLILTVPLSSPALALVYGVATAQGRIPALSAMNDVYRAAPAYFHALGASYQNRVITVDLQYRGGWNSIGQFPDDYPDGVHPTGERAKVITANALYSGIKHLLSGGANTVIY